MTSERYNAREAEARWQKVWDERGIFATRNDDPRQKYYVLEMFPYPSGRIHMGHVRNYTMGDVVARFKRARSRPAIPPTTSTSKRCSSTFFARVWSNASWAR